MHVSTRQGLENHVRCFLECNVSSHCNNDDVLWLDFTRSAWTVSVEHHQTLHLPRWLQFLLKSNYSYCYYWNIVMNSTSFRILHLKFMTVSCSRFIVVSFGGSCGYGELFEGLTSVRWQLILLSKYCTIPHDHSQSEHMIWVI